MVGMPLSVDYVGCLDRLTMLLWFDQHPSSWLVATSFVLLISNVGFLPDMPCYLCTIQVTSENLPEKHAQQKSRLDEWVARSNSI